MICPCCKKELPEKCGECDEPFKIGQIVCCMVGEENCHWHAGCNEHEDYGVISE